MQLKKLSRFIFLSALLVGTLGLYSCSNTAEADIENNWVCRENGQKTCYLEYPQEHPDQLLADPCENRAAYPVALNSKHGYTGYLVVYCY